MHVLTDAETSPDALHGMPVAVLGYRAQAEHDAGLPNLTKWREEARQHPIEVVGREVRALCVAGREAAKAKS